MVRAFGSNAQPSNSQDVLLWVVIRKNIYKVALRNAEDIIRKDLNDLKIPESCWYDLQINQDLPGKTITMPVWSLVKCHLAMLIYKLLSALNVSEVSDARDLKRDK